MKIYFTACCGEQVTHPDNKEIAICPDCGDWAELELIEEEEPHPPTYAEGDE